MKIPSSPQTTEDILNDWKGPGRTGRLAEILLRGIDPAPEGKYRHWDKLRRLQPPHGLTSEEWWAGIKFARFQMRREVSLKDKKGKSFFYTLADPVLEALHEIDRNASGRIATNNQITNPHTKDRYIQSSLIEEAITSSQLEGASTTREVAKAMIRSGRDPLDQSERMIFNNYRAIQLISGFKKQALSSDLLFTLHQTITKGTLSPKISPPYLREAGERVAVYDARDNTLLHDPPPAHQIQERLSAMYRFANSKPTGTFLHPILKAVILHFWLAFDHPFVDGNGRTARALFYWSALSQGFWLFEFLSISSIIRKAPVRYGRSFLYTETDENDLTYFILAQLRIIKRAINELYRYLGRKTQEIQETERLLQASVVLNHRQLALLSHALRHPGARYTIGSHKNSHNVTYQTARTDLFDLEKKQLLMRRKPGRAFLFTAASDLSKRLQQIDV